MSMPWGQAKDQKDEAAIREKSGTCRFADHSERVAVLLLRVTRVTRVSVEAQALVERMRKEMTR